LYAPWRIEYILAPKPELKAGLFTRIAQSSDDEANYVIVRDRTCFALLNAYPYISRRESSLSTSISGTPFRKFGLVTDISALCLKP